MENTAKKELEYLLDCWKRKVLCAYDYKENGVGINTLHMILDVDEIIANAFGHDTVIER